MATCTVPVTTSFGTKACGEELATDSLCIDHAYELSIPSDGIWATPASGNSFTCDGCTECS